VELAYRKQSPAHTEIFVNSEEEIIETSDFIEKTETLKIPKITEILEYTEMAETSETPSN